VLPILAIVLSCGAELHPNKAKNDKAITKVVEILRIKTS
jgi:hypothetical protein